MPFFFDHMHYAQVAAVLRAADIECRVVSNPGHTAVEVHLEDESRIVWGNDGLHWAYTMVREDGEVFTVESLLLSTELPEVVAQVIAEWPYASKPASVLAD